MRPWVLDRRFANEEVPFIADLDVVPVAQPKPISRRLRCKQPRRGIPVRNYAASWSWYVRGNVVTRHAKRLIVQFMAANCGKTKRGEDEYFADDDGNKQSRE